MFTFNLTKSDIAYLRLLIDLYSIDEDSEGRSLIYSDPDNFAKISNYSSINKEKIKS